MATLLKGTYSRDISKGEKLRRAVSLLFALAARDIKARYRRSSLGLLWNFLQPLLNFAIYIIIRLLFNIPSDGIPILLFVLSTTIPWQYFSSVAINAPNSIIANANIFKKIDVQHEVFILSGALVSGIDFLIGFVVLIIGMIYYKVPIGWHLLWLPVLMILLLALAVGVGIFFASIGVFKADILAVSTSLFQIWFFLTPTIYPITMVPDKILHLYKLNPAVGLMTGFRDIIAVGQAPDTQLLLFTLVGIIIIWAVAFPIFRRTAPYFSDML